MKKGIKLISVIGSGTMGNGIAHSFALAGFQVHLIDISEENLKPLSVNKCKGIIVVLFFETNQ